MMINLNVTSYLRETIQQIKLLDEELQAITTQSGFASANDEVLLFNPRACVPKDVGLRILVLEEAHKSMFTTHPGSGKMYQGLNKDYWWPSMKKNIAKYVAECVASQQVKIDHQRPSGLLQPLEIPEKKWDSISMDFVVGLPRIHGGYNLIWVIVDRL